MYKIPSRSEEPPTASATIPMKLPLLPSQELLVRMMYFLPENLVAAHDQETSSQNSLSNAKAEDTS